MSITPAVAGDPAADPGARRSVLQQWQRRVRLSLRMARINLRGQADFRVDFVLSILDGLLWQTSTIVFASVLLVRFAGIGDWPNTAVLLLVAMRMTAHGLTTLTTGRINFIGFIISEGQIDTFLTRPLSVYRQIMFSKFNVNAFGDLLVGLTMLGFAVALYDQPWTAGRVLLLIGGIVGGTFVEAGVTTAISGLALIRPWAITWQWRFAEILSTVGNYPLTILPLVARTLLTFVIPIAFVAYLPAAALTGQVAATGLPRWLVYGSPLAGVLIYALSRLVWTACLDRYQGANS